MAQMFSRWLGGVDDLPAGMFTVATENKRAVVSCPMCGTKFELPRHCLPPDQTGRVVPSFQCESDTCGWWDFAVLESHWEAP